MQTGTDISEHNARFVHDALHDALPASGLFAGHESY